MPRDIIPVTDPVATAPPPPVSADPADRPPHAPEPFESAEQAWFWFVQAYEARSAGARFLAGQGTTARPCEPLDILRAVDRLRRTRRLMRDHIAVLGHYGRRLCPPDPKLRPEMRAAALWQEALDRLGDVLRGKGIILRDPTGSAPTRPPRWAPGVSGSEWGPPKDLGSETLVVGGVQ